MSEEYIVHNDAIYKKVTDLNALVKHCKFCDKAFILENKEKYIVQMHVKVKHGEKVKNAKQNRK